MKISLAVPKNNKLSNRLTIDVKQVKLRVKDNRKPKAKPEKPAPASLSDVESKLAK